MDPFSKVELYMISNAINVYLAIDSDGLCERIVYRAVIAARLNTSQKS